MDLTLPGSTVNDRLKEVIQGLKATYDDIERVTGVSRSTWIRMTKPGASVKIEHVDLLSSNFDIDGDYVKTGKRSVPTLGMQVEEEQTPYGKSVPTLADNQVNEEKEKFREFIGKHRKGSAGSKLNPEDYDNPMVILDAAVKDLTAEWKWIVQNEKDDKARKEWLKGALKVINRIATKHLDRLDSEQED